MRFRPGAILVIFAASSAASFARTAHAEPSATDRAVAQTLFDEGRTLMDQGKYAEACARFSRSQKLDPGAGTVLNLALCHEGEGKVATAWTEFNEALSQAKRDHREDRETLAREHVDALGPRVPHAMLRVDDKSTQLEVRLDGVLLDRGAWDAPIPIDPGEHAVTASAPGRKAWNARVRFAPGESVTVTVPVLEEGPVDTSVSAPPAPEPTRSDGTLGWVLVGSGAVATGVGAYFGVRALGAKNDSDRLCPSSPCSDPEAVSLSKDAVAFGWGANIGIGVGLVAIGIGTYLLLTAHQSTPPAATASKLRATPLLRGGSVALTF